MPARLTIEEWRPVVGREQDYEVSNLGRVRSLTRSWEQRTKSGSTYVHTKTGKVLKPGIMSAGYPTVCLGRARGNRISGTRTVHSLVAEAFIGACPDNQEVRHKDGDRTNPHASNLEYGTRTENIYDAVAHGTWHSNGRRRSWDRWRGSGNPNFNKGGS